MSVKVAGSRDFSNSMKQTIKLFLLALMLAACASPALAQSTQCNDANKGTWYKTFLNNRKGGTAQQKIAAEAAQNYLDCGDDPNDDIARYLKKWLGEYKQVPSGQSTTVTGPASNSQRTFTIEEAGIQFAL